MSIIAPTIIIIDSLNKQRVAVYGNTIAIYDSIFLYYVSSFQTHIENNSLILDQMTHP